MKRMISMMFVLAVVFALSGCQKELTLEQPYAFEERVASFAEEPSNRSAEAYAEAICVASGADETMTPLAADAAAVFALDSSELVYEKNALTRMNPASTTKIMTAIVALRYGNLSDMVTVTEDAVITESGSSMAGVKPGDVISLKDLLYGLMLPSGNDAANAIAVHVGGSIENFVTMMNEEAKRIYATGTQFRNANGLTDPEHYTTAYDLYLMFREALTYETFREIIGTHAYVAQFTDAAGAPKTASWGVTNFYMNGQVEVPSGLKVFGGKTGTTQAAGYCLIMGNRTEDGREYASVIMKSDSRKGLYEDMTEIISKIDK